MRGTAATATVADTDMITLVATATDMIADMITGMDMAAPAASSPGSVAVDGRGSRVGATSGIAVAAGGAGCSTATRCSFCCCG